MDRFEDIENAKPGDVLSVATADGLHVVGIVAGVDPKERTLSFAGGRVVTFEAAAEPTPAEAPEEGEA